MEASKKPLFDVFNGSRLLKIPFFQRSYVWGEDEWERFFDDIVNMCQNKKEYFMGSLILKKQETDTGEKGIVIDGQQRLTTLSILLKVLCLKTGEMSQFDRKFRVDDGNIILEHNHNDIEDYNKIMDLKEFTVLEPEKKKGKQKKEREGILGAYDYFVNKIKEDSSTFKKLDFQTIVGKLNFIVIELGHEEDEQQIFDTINSLGVRLTTAELLKNYFFSDDRDIKKYEEYWLAVFEKDDKKYWDKEMSDAKKTFIDMFFFAYLQIKVYEISRTKNVKNKDREDFSRLDRLFTSYKKFIKDYLESKKQIILDEIKEYASTFKEVINPDIIKDELPKEPGIERINAIIFALDTTTIIPYVLYVERNVKKKDEKNKIYAYLESFIMRRMVAKITTKNYNKLFSDYLISNEILSVAALKDYFATQKDKTNCMPDNDEVKKGFHESYLTNNQAKGVLYFIESSIRNRGRHSAKLLGIKGYTTEHMMPKKWSNKWSKPDKVSDDERDNILLTLGNLTIITGNLNKSLRDSAWKTKVNGNSRYKGLKYYSSEIEILFGALEKEEWNEETIYERAENLAKRALGIWKK